MRDSVAGVFARLKAEGLATAEDEALAREALAKESEDDMPWYLRLAVGFGAWIATGFFLGFLFQIFEPDSVAIRILYGTLLIVFAVFVRARTRSEFLKQAAVAASLAGQGLIIATVGDKSGDAETAATVLALSVALVPLMPDRLHRFISAAVGAGAFAVLAVELEISYGLTLATLSLVALTAYVWRVRIGDRSARVAEMLGPVGYGLIVALFGIMLWSAVTGVASLALEMGSQVRKATLGPATTIGVTLALMALVWKVIDEHDSTRNSAVSFAGLAGAGALGLAALSSPGIVTGIAVLILAYDRRDAVLLGLAVLFLLVFASFYYYSLQLTLLEKSGVLAGTGLLLIAIRQRIAPSRSEEVAV